MIFEEKEYVIDDKKVILRSALSGCNQRTASGRLDKGQ